MTAERLYDLPLECELGSGLLIESAGQRPSWNGGAARLCDELEP